MLRKKKCKRPCSEHQDCPIWGACTQRGCRLSATSFLGSSNLPHSRHNQSFPSLCHHKPRSGKLCLTHAMSRPIWNKVSLRIQGSSLDLRTVSPLWRGVELENAYHWLNFRALSRIHMMWFSDDHASNGVWVNGFLQTITTWEIVLRNLFPNKYSAKVIEWP